jgi:hypothetical protein
VLLKQLQPYYSQQNLSIAPPYSNSHNKSPLVNKGGEQLSAIKGATPNTTRATKKKLFHSENEQGVARILENINVVVKKPDSTNLPPIK